MAVTWASSAFCASLHPLVRGGFFLDEGQVGLQRLAFLGGILVVHGLFEAGIDAGFGQLALVGFGLEEQAVLAAVFLVEFLHLAGDGVAVGLQLLDGRLFLGEVAGDDERLRDEIGVGLATILAITLDGLPAVLHEQVHIVLHGLGPVVHEVLVHVVGVEQAGFLEGVEQIFRERFDQGFGMVAGLDGFEARGVGLPPFREQRGHAGVERGELGVAEDGGFDFAHRRL